MHIQARKRRVETRNLTSLNSSSCKNRQDIEALMVEELALHPVSYIKPNSLASTKYIFPA
jgi:hypothetical protein